MSITRRHLMLASPALFSTLPAVSSAQNVTGVVRLVVPYPPGGGSDLVARLVADRLGPRLGTTVIVENRTGAGGRVAAQSVRNTPADQNVLLLANPAIMVVAPLVFKDSGYDPDRDYQPVSQVSGYEFGVAVGPGVPVKELNHLLAWLRANPNQANLGVPATGSLPHFFGLMVGAKAGVKAQIVGYRGSAPLITDLIGGQIPAAVDTLESLLPQHEGGKLRILAVSGAKRSAIAPGVPTFKEAGLDLEAEGWNAFFAPASMPAARVRLLGDALRAVMAEPAMAKRFREANMEPVSSSAAQTAATLKAFKAQWEPVVKTSGYQP